MRVLQEAGDDSPERECVGPVQVLACRTRDQTEARMAEVRYAVAGRWQGYRLARRSPCQLTAPMPSDAEIAISGAATDAELSALHAAAFGYDDPSRYPWNERMQRYSLFWVTARDADQLVGFVNVLGDGGLHAILMDTCVRPSDQRRGIGRAVIAAAADEARARGCQWLHADYDPEQTPFYEVGCQFRRTNAGLIELTG